ncbi:MAG: DUF2851 family protein [Bacteroidia bacterium]|nr:DUF2851 family protein [Bacteroidia bacterium]
MKQLYPPSEGFLHYVWEKRYLPPKGLLSSDNQDLQILKPGILNLNQGPDFLNAKIQIDEVFHHGQVEIHLHSQDWYRHRHHLDPHYNSCILHVVFESNNVPALRQDGTEIPELVLKPHIKETLWHKYDQLRLSDNKIPCNFYLEQVSNTDKKAMLERHGIARFRSKVEVFNHQLKDKQQNWSQILWEALAKCLGGSVNGGSFAQMADFLPFRLVKQYANQVLQLEALFFGALGLLEGDKADDYRIVLKNEWSFLKIKHKLKAVALPPIKFLRMHPASFPTIRISQLANLIHQFSAIEDLLFPENWDDLFALEIKAGNYWESHIRFGEEKGKEQPRRIGIQLKERLLVNVLGPLSFLYLKHHGRRAIIEASVNQLAALSPENNRITRKWAGQGFPNENAIHSQGIIRLAKSFCLEKRCLECEIGQRIIKP